MPPQNSFDKPELPHLEHYDSSRCLHQLFEEHAKQRPGNIALIDERSTLSFEELNRKANRVASAIIDRQIRPGAFVGICLERSAGVIVSILGILKAGCAYIPLDPANPPERLRFVVEDASLALTITSQKHRSKLPESHPVLIAGDAELRSSRPEANPGLPCDPSDTAYVIYTSGSTGQPKGVCCHHRGVVNLLDDFQSRQFISHADRCSWWSNPGFDVSIYELFAPLIAGATLLVVPEQVRLDVGILMEWLKENGVTSAFLPPMMIEDYLAWVTSHPGASRLRRLLTGVESLPEKLMLGIDQAVADLTIINGYGPTETTVCATLYTVAPVGESRKDTPIGKPVQNMRIHLLDDEGHEIAPGETGEICICGAGVSNGYLNRPELNASLFVADPCSKERRLPMYKTGDLGYLLADGNLVFAGRKDFQVKHMGYRIEPGEIEAVLRSHEQVREAVVMLRDVKPGVRHLVGYITCKAGAALTPAEIDAFMRKVLPKHMIPAAFVVLDAIPMTANGKTDRKALPLPGKQDFPGSKTDATAKPGTPEEREITEIFATLLGVQEIGAEDNFFSLGGNSLLATRLASMMRQRWNVALPLECIFKHSTPRALAAEISISTPTDKPDRIPEDMAKQTLFPATWLQKGMWLLQQLQSEGNVLNIPVIVTITGPLDTGALKKALELMVARHESLRSVFTLHEEQLNQKVVSSVQIPWAEKDLSGLDQAQAAIALEEIRKKEGAHAFNFEKGPLFRLVVVRVADEKYQLFLTISHLIIDGWGSNIFFREWIECYDALAEGRSPSLPEKKIDYSDFALWQERRIEGPEITGQIKYWIDKLKEYSFSQELPSDNPRPSVQTYPGKRLPVGFTPERSSEIKAYCERNNCTPYMFLLAVFQVLLHRYSGRSSIISGTTIANRNNPQIEDIVGLFVNNLAIVTDFSGNPGFDEVLAQVRSNSLEAFDHQDAPFGIIAEKLTGHRDRSRHPVFQNLFILQNTPEPLFSAGDVWFEYEEVGNDTAKIDLLLNVEVRHGFYKGWFEYNTDLFNASTIERLAEDFVWIAEKALSQPNEQVTCWNLPSIPAVEQVAPFDSAGLSCCHQLFEQQAESNPDRIAIRCDDRTLTYREVNEQANRLARYLIDKGVGPDVTVGLCMDRTPELYIGLLGILKAGGAYVPVDPAYPEERIRFMIEDSGMAIAVTDRPSSFRLSSTGEVDAVVLDELGEALAGLSPETPELRAGSDHIAYIMYTSGSTGTPKGVMVTHGGVTNLARAAVSSYGIESSDSILQFFSISFDGSVEEVFMAFASGATLVVRSFPVEVSAQEFLEHLDRLSVSVLDLPTAYWHVLVTSLGKASAAVPNSLRLIIIGGEQALVNDFIEWEKISGGRTKVLNTYGPTECTVVSLFFEPGKNLTGNGNRQGLPIGVPIDNTSIAVVSESMHMMPFGMPGELLIGGQGVARGYLNRPELTGEKFIDALSCTGLPDGRFYRTGDRVRFLEDGNLQFLGRLDNQVKVRGFRVEPGEIEAVLNRHPALATSAVIVHRNDFGQSSLIAYFIAESKPPAISELRYFLLETLPEYMVPARFIALDEFPHLPNGKIDRNSFPLPELSIDRSSSHTPPRNDLEKRLVSVWEEVLDVHPIGIHDDFFDLGGHSLTAVRLCSRIQESTNIPVTLSGLFQSLTIEALARQIQQNALPSENSCAVTIQQGFEHLAHPPLFMIHVLGTGLKFCRPLVANIGPEIPVYGLSVHLLESSPVDATAVENLARFYVDEVKKIQPEGPYFFSGVSFGGIVAFEMARLLSAQNDDVRLVAFLDSILATAYKQLDTQNRLHEHRQQLREQGISYLFQKAGERMSSEVAKISAKATALTLALRLKYHTLRKRTAFMPIELKEFAARRENDKAWQNYKPTPYKGNLTLFRSSDHKLGVSEFIDPLLGWGDIALDGIEVIDCPGDHLSMLREPNVKILAQKLRESIGKALKNKGDQAA